MHQDQKKVSLVTLCSSTPDAVGSSRTQTNFGVKWWQRWLPSDSEEYSIYFLAAEAHVRTYATVRPSKNSREACKLPKRSCVLQTTHIHLNTEDKAQGWPRGTKNYGDDHDPCWGNTGTRSVTLWRKGIQQKGTRHNREIITLVNIPIELKTPTAGSLKPNTTSSRQPFQWKRSHKKFVFSRCGVVANTPN